MTSNLNVCQSESDYKSLVDLLARSARARRIVAFVGAGISNDPPSLMPLGNEIENNIREDILSSIDKIHELKSVCTSKKQKALDVVGTARLERLLDVLYDTHGSAVLGYLEPFKGELWNENHACLAALANARYLPWCISLNFDRLIELAMAKIEVAFDVSCPLADHTRHFRSELPVTTVIKPHGSLFEEDVKGGRFDYIRTTLKDVGTYPQRANKIAIKKALAEKPTLLVAGYSDNDWDIFPVLEENADLIGSVVWVKHSKIKESGQDLSWDRVGEWLSSHKKEHHVFVGSSKSLLMDMVKTVGLEIVMPVKKQSDDQSVESSRVLRNDTDDLSTTRTLISLAALVQHTGEYSKTLLQWLEKSQLVQNHTELLHRTTYLISHTAHTSGDLPKAVIYTTRTLREKRKTSDQGNTSIAEVEVWLGYEYLCLCKRPYRPYFLWPLFVPYFIAKGLIFLSKGISLEKDSREVEKLKAKSAFYVVDLFHSWGTLLLLLGKKASIIVKLYHLILLQFYKLIPYHPETSEEGYYWLRRLEARILSGRVGNNRASIDRKLKELERAYIVLQNNVQIGNIQAYRALMAGVIDDDPSCAEKLLLEADRKWREHGKDIESGHRRVMIYNRFLGYSDIGFVQSIKELIKGKSE